MPQSNDRTTTMRRDARQNRSAVLSAAAQLFARHGVETPLEHVARSAGVGIATLYRNFPTRDDLLSALLEVKERELLDNAALARKHPDADVALEAWLDALLDYLTTFNGLPDPLLHAVAEPSSSLAVNCDCLLLLTTQFLERAQQEGSARTGITANTLFVATLGVAWANNQANVDTEGFHSVRTLLRDGYRTLG